MSFAVRAWRALLAGLITLFVLNIGLMIAAVVDALEGVAA